MNSSARLSKQISSGPYGKAEDMVRQIKQNWQIEGCIKDITIKTRNFRGSTLVQGFQVSTKEGLSKAVGMNFNDFFNTKTFEVPKDRYISKVHIKYGAYINKLGFILDNGDILGESGLDEKDGVKTIPEETEGRKTKLTGITGITVQSEKAPVICNVQFNFDCENT